jgi:hypothetical protein
VYTNRDLKPVPSASAPNAHAPLGDERRTPAVLPRPSKQKGDGATGEEAREEQQDQDTGQDEETGEDEAQRRTADEQQWRARIAAARDQVERSRTFAEALQSRINALNGEFSARDDPAQRAVIGGHLNKALAELERVRAEIEAQQKGVEDLEEEARRAGVPPGWLR